MTEQIRRVPVRFTSVKPTPERVQARAERIAADYGGTLIEVTPLLVGRNRRRSAVWDATVIISKEGTS